MPKRQNKEAGPIPSGEAWMSLVISCIFCAAVEMWEAERGHLRLFVEQLSCTGDWAGRLTPLLMTFDVCAEDPWKLRCKERLVEDCECAGIEQGLW